jgi:hypothetical protein
MDTNPPPNDHWFYNLFEGFDKRGDFVGVPENHIIFHQPSGLADNAENIRNLPQDYYENMIPGKTKEWVDVYVHGKYGFVADGKPIYPEYNDDIHYVDEDYTVDPKKTVYIGIDFGLCYDKDTEVLTASGWKLFKDVDEHFDLVATRNPLTKEMSYTPINFKVAKPFKGKLLQWSSTEVCFTVTPEHRVPFTFRDSPDTVCFESAQWLADHHSGHHFVDVTSKWIGRIPEYYCDFMGWWCSDGHVCKKTNRLSIGQKKPKYMDKLIQALNGTGLKFRFGQDCFRASNLELADYLKSLGAKSDCRIPVEIGEFTPELIERFLLAYTYGDGQIRTKPNGSEEWTICAPSQKCAGELQVLIQKAGYNSSVREQLPQKSQLKDGRVITATKSVFIVTVKRRSKRAELLHRNYSEIDYDDTVYCLNVPFHTLYVRKNGKPSWNGNTPAALFGQLTSSGAMVLFDELVTFDMGAVSFGRLLRQKMNEQRFAGATFEVYGDPAGVGRAQSDESTPFQMLDKAGISAFPTYTNDPVIRREVVADYLMRLDFSGKPAFRIYKDAPMFRRGMNGGYCYKRLQVVGEDRFQDVPDKNKWSHITESGQYLFLGAVGGNNVLGGYGKKDLIYTNKGIV